MRHLKAGKRLGVTTSHRKAMMRNLVTSLLEHGEIKTTVTRAKEMRKYFDKMIGLGKKNDLHAKRQAFAFIKSREVVKKLFEEYGPLYAERNGGYTRIFKLGRRLGDNAQMALIQMVDLKGEAKVAKVEKEKIEELKEELEEKSVAAEVQEEVAEETVEETTEEEVKASSEEEVAEEEPAAEEAVEESDEKEEKEEKEK